MSNLPYIFATGTAVALVTCMTLILRAFYPLVEQRLEPFGMHMVKGVYYLAIAKALRATYWDILPDVLGPMGAWEPLRDTLGGVSFNAFFNLLVIYATFHFLKARYHAIPEDDRAGWYWFTAWAHPGDRCVINWRRKP